MNPINPVAFSSTYFSGSASRLTGRLQSSFGQSVDESPKFLGNWKYSVSVPGPRLWQAGDINGVLSKFLRFNMTVDETQPDTYHLKGWLTKWPKRHSDRLWIMHGPEISGTLSKLQQYDSPILLSWTGSDGRYTKLNIEPAASGDLPHMTYEYYYPNAQAKKPHTQFTVSLMPTGPIIENLRRVYDKYVPHNPFQPSPPHHNHWLFSETLSPVKAA